MCKAVNYFEDEKLQVGCSVGRGEERRFIKNLFRKINPENVGTSWIIYYSMITKKVAENLFKRE